MWYTTLGAFVMTAALATAACPGMAQAAHELPGMCNGRKDPNLVVTAHANGRPDSVPKYILNVTTDASAVPTGSLVLDRGGSRIQVTDFCRVWHHRPGDTPMGGDDCHVQEDATNVHAVGIAELRDGTRILVRTDVRGSDEGLFFRVRYRPIGGHQEEEQAHDGCDEVGWTRVPTEGWYPLDQLRVREVAMTA